MARGAEKSARWRKDSPAKRRIRERLCLSFPPSFPPFPPVFDVKLDERGRPIEEEDELDLGENCIIVQPTQAAAAPATAEEAEGPASTKRGKRSRGKKRR